MTQMNKNKLRRDFLRLLSSRILSASKRRSGLATAVSPQPPIFPPNFFKTKFLLAFPQIHRQNDVQTNVNELQPSVCLLLPFYFPVV
jgi:hypothetical protein